MRNHMAQTKSRSFAHVSFVTECHNSSRLQIFLAECGRSFCERKVLERHEITHDLPSELRRNFECTECEKRFISREARQSHYAKHHEKVLSFFCDICSKVSSCSTVITVVLTKMFSHFRVFTQENP